MDSLTAAACGAACEPAAASHDLWCSQADNAGVNIVAFAISSEAGAELTDLLANLETAAEKPILMLEMPILEGSHSGVAAFSGRGPAADGRIKPDILAPGVAINSVRSDGDLSTFQCGAPLAAVPRFRFGANPRPRPAGFGFVPNRNSALPQRPTAV
jgi:hypothetical protein